MDIKYGIVALYKSQLLNADSDDILSVVHFVGYEEPPTFQDYISLYKELATDEYFDLIDEIDDIILLPATEDVVQKFKEDIDNQIGRN